MGEKSTKQIVLAFTASMIAFSLFLVYFIYDFKQKRVESFYNSKKKELQNIINTYIKTEYERDMLLAKSLASSPAIKDALKKEQAPLESADISRIDELVYLFDEIKSKEIWFQLLSKDFISLYRSWDKKVGDDVSFRKELQIIKNSPKPMQLISVGRYSVAYKNIFPIFVGDAIVGYSEVIVPLQRTSQLLHIREGLGVALFIDKKYSTQLDRAISPKYINGYNLVYGSDTSFEKTLEGVDFARLASSDGYLKVGDFVVTAVSILDIDGKNMAYFVAQKELGSFEKELEKEVGFISLLQIVTIVMTVILVFYFLWYLYVLKSEMRLIKKLNDELTAKLEEEREKIRVQEEAIFRQKRDSSIKELMLNIAHQWRQPLNIIAIKLQSLDDVEGIGENAKEKLALIIDEALKEVFELSEIITKFSSFYSMQEKSKIFKLSDSIRQSVSLCSGLLKSSNINVKLHLQDDVKIEGSFKEMIEVFLEFISNVKDVVKKRSLSGAEMTFTTKMSGGMVRIIIEDNAGGIEENLLGMIFDPYTTTSFKKRKKGLGMSIVKRIIEERFGGTISVENSGEGARFEISLQAV